MLLVADVAASTSAWPTTASKRCRAASISAASWRCRSVVPAITHVDYSARVQTVDDERHGRYYRLIKRFNEKTGCPVIINTSFNVRGEPIVCSPEHAYRCFLATNMDVLVLEDSCCSRKSSPSANDASNRRLHLAQFDLDLTCH